MKNIWNELKKPILILAPMDDVTDTVFRQVIIHCGKPDLFFTEFVNTDGLCSKGREKLLPKLKFEKNEKPIVAQIWGNNPQNYYASAKLIEKLGFDGIDINLGCPDRSIVRKGACSGLIKNTPLVKEIIKATQEGVKKIPVSVKTRIGYDKLQTEEWIGFLLEQNLDAITIHGRITTEMSKYAANWEEIGKAVQLRNLLKRKTLIIGNGDVKSYSEAIEKHKVYGVDGVMIGRGIFQNPWIFNPAKDLASVSKEEKIQLLIYHLNLFQKTYKGTRHFDSMKKFYKMYLSDFADAQNLRTKLMQYSTVEDSLKVLSFCRKRYSELRLLTNH